MLALTIPDSIRTRISFRTGFLLDVLNGWAKPMALPPDEKIALLSDPARRRELNEMAQQTDGPARGIAYWQVFTVAEVFTPSLEQYVGRTVGEIAATEGKEPWDVVCDITVADGLRTIFTPPDRGADDESWKARVDVWRDPRAIIGASDAGAHLDFLATFNYSTTMLAEAVRKRGLLATEEAVSLLTNAQARLYGLTGRGRLAEGWCADIVVFDESTIGPGPVVTVEDLPGGAPAPLRRGRGDRARARQRRGDRARRCVHRRAARPAAAVRPRHRERHRAGRSRLNPARSLGASGCQSPARAKNSGWDTRCGNHRTPVRRRRQAHPHPPSPQR